eukprot:CAMPEP_0119364372 /NCGR_PEP_ID=MMETSP1334-20130426/11292_1 /TAXON_ID=127549 /ORGANISM="Calcidiscus leptoporus, Strain RCC1130" /LENGTH=77 /DNA_ID=CAMNT_0007380057 /DNA_START=478 /DNA_END=708 /DNA_ORIENTATION=-
MHGDVIDAGEGALMHRAHFWMRRPRQMRQIGSALEQNERFASGASGDRISPLLPVLSRFEASMSDWWARFMRCRRAR